MDEILLKEVKSKTILFAACFLIVLGGWGAARSYKTAKAQKIYYTTRFHNGEEKDSIPLMSMGGAVDAAMKLYPYNYYFLMYACRNALNDAQNASTKEEYDFYINWARQYVRRAMALNPYQAQIRWLHAEILAESGKVDEAIDYWVNDVVDREFWNSSHHEFLVRLYLRSTKSGSLKKAVDELPFIKDAELRKRLTKLQKLLK